MNSGIRRRAFGLVLGAVCTLLVGAIYAASSSDSAFLDAVWVSESGGVHKIDANGGNHLFHIGEHPDVSAIAIDDRAGTTWVFSQNKLYLYSFQGQQQRIIQIPEAGPPTLDTSAFANIHESDALEDTYCQLGDVVTGTLPPSLLWASAKLATSPEDGSAWLGLGDRLYQFSPEGFQLSNIQVPRTDHRNHRGRNTFARLGVDLP